MALDKYKAQDKDFTSSPDDAKPQAEAKAEAPKESQPGMVRLKVQAAMRPGLSGIWAGGQHFAGGEEKEVSVTKEQAEAIKAKKTLGLMVQELDAPKK